jgi:DNA-directed RNA polymerase subunit RPC12/RpoP
MRVPSRTMSRANRIVCPVCGSGKLELRGLLGSHACECGHPEMRHLPDGVFQCPSCGSEVFPIKERKSIEWRNERRVRRGRSHKDQRGGKEVSSDRSKRS